MSRRPPRRVAVGPDRWKELGAGCAVLVLALVLAATRRGTSR